MTILGSRLNMLLAEAPAWLHVPQDAAEGAFAGRYLRIEGRPFALGRELGRGEEAFVFELVDLRTGQFDYVVKVCRHRPESDRARQWAVPIRFQRNVAARIPDIELYPCRLVAIPGGVVKIQRYISADPRTDWLSRLPIQPVAAAIAAGREDDARRLLAEFVRQHDEQAVFVDMRAYIAFREDRVDEALALYVTALASHIARKNSSRFCVAIQLAEVLETLYRRDRSRGVSEMSGTLNDGSVLSNTFFASATEAAMDDSLQDRSLFVLLEVLADLPYFVAALNFIQCSLGGLTRSFEFQTVSAAVEQIDPENPLLGELREKGWWQGRRAQVEQHAELPQEQAPESPDAGYSVPVVPLSLRHHLAEHERAYRPETETIRGGHARVVAALAQFRAGRAGEAEANLREAIRIEPHIADHRVALANLFTATGRHEAAVATLRDALDAVKGEPLLRLLLGRALLEAGDIDKAKHVLLRARPLLPDWDAQIRLMLAEIDERRQL